MAEDSAELAGIGDGRAGAEDRLYTSISGMSHEAAQAYDLFADLYDDYVSDFREDMPFWQSVVGEGASVVEIGCGTGRVMAALLGRTESIVGVDISLRMLHKARARLEAALMAGRAELLQHDLAQAPMVRAYDVALVTFYTFNYVTERGVEFLGNVLRSLVPAGLLAMDLFCPLPVRQPELNGVARTRRVQSGGHNVSLVDTRFMQGAVEVRTQVYGLPSGPRTVVTKRRYYRPREMDGMLARAGFIDRKFALGYDYGSLDVVRRLPRTSAGFILTARRPGGA